MRTLFQLQYHLLMSHAVPQLKLVCPLDVMTEWEEMLWGILRRWSVQMCNKAPGSMCINIIVRTHYRRQVQEAHGTRQEFSAAAYRGAGPLPTQYEASGFKDADEADIILGAKYLDNKNCQAFIRTIAEFLPSGLWHEIGDASAGGDASRTLTIKCGDSSPNWADPSPLDCSKHSLADVRQQGVDALEAYGAQDLSEHERAIMFPTSADREVKEWGAARAMRTGQRGPAARRSRLAASLAPPGRVKGGGEGEGARARREPPPRRRVQATEHASQELRDKIARDTGDADDQDWGDKFAQEDAEEARAEAEDELGCFEDGMGDLNSYAFIAYEHVRDRLFIVEVNALTLQGVMAGQGRGTQCINAAVTHLPAGVNPDEVETVDLHQHRDNLHGDHLYTARKFWDEEREGQRLYQVEEEATWRYRRAGYRTLREELAVHPKVINSQPMPHWEYFASRLQLETTAPHLWEIVKTMTERFHEGQQVRE